MISISPAACWFTCILLAALWEDYITMPSIIGSVYLDESSLIALDKLITRINSDIDNPIYKAAVNPKTRRCSRNWLIKVGIEMVLDALCE